MISNAKSKSVHFDNSEQFNSVDKNNSQKFRKQNNLETPEYH